jgi:hypothetical protein
MSDKHNDAGRRFARRLFTASDDEDQVLDDQDQDQHRAAGDDERHDDRAFARNLFAPDDEDQDVADEQEGGPGQVGAWP